MRHGKGNLRGGNTRGTPDGRQTMGYQLRMGKKRDPHANVRDRSGLSQDLVLSTMGSPQLPDTDEELVIKYLSRLGG